MNPLRESSLIVGTLSALGVCIVLITFRDLSSAPSAPVRAVVSPPGMVAVPGEMAGASAEPGVPALSLAYTVPAGVDANETRYAHPHGETNPHRARYFASTRGKRPALSEL